VRRKYYLIRVRRVKRVKKVALKGKYLLTKEDILKVVQDLKEGTKKKKTEKRRKKDEIYTNFFRGRRRRFS
jgi:hypothetical protein